jgi:hypothetical protein
MNTQSETTIKEIILNVIQSDVNFGTPISSIVSAFEIVGLSSAYVAGIIDSMINSHEVSYNNNLIWR